MWTFITGIRLIFYICVWVHRIFQKFCFCLFLFLLVSVIFLFCWEQNAQYRTFTCIHAGKEVLILIYSKFLQDANLMQTNISSPFLVFCYGFSGIVFRLILEGTSEVCWFTKILTVCSLLNNNRQSIWRAGDCYTVI